MITRNVSVLLDDERPGDINNLIITVSKYDQIIILSVLSTYLQIK